MFGWKLTGRISSCGQRMTAADSNSLAGMSLMDMQTSGNEWIDLRQGSRTEATIQIGRASIFVEMLW